MSPHVSTDTPDDMQHAAAYSITLRYNTIQYNTIQYNTISIPIAKAVLNLKSLICKLFQLVQHFVSYGLSVPLLILYLLFFISFLF
jgi:hypothetical protein